MNYLSVGDVARRLGVPPKTISDFLYLRRLDERRAPLIAGRRCVEEGYLPAISDVLRSYGKLPEKEPATV